jgi:hypothetical protein
MVDRCGLARAEFGGVSRAVHSQKSLLPQRKTGGCDAHETFGKTKVVRLDAVGCSDLLIAPSLTFD